MKFNKFQKYQVGKDVSMLPPREVEKGSLSGVDCTQNCLPYARLDPDYFALVTGHIRVAMIDKQKGIKVEDSLAWNLPYRSHTWIEDIHGRIYDPSLQNLVAYCEIEEHMMQLAKPIEEMIGIRYFESEQKQKYLLDRMDKETNSYKVQTDGVDIVYMPGIFIDIPDDFRPDSMQWLEMQQCHNTRINGGYYTAEIYDKLTEMAEEIYPHHHFVFN